MPKAHGVIAILGPFAHEPDPDEQHEQDNAGHDDEDFLDAVFHRLRDGDKETTRALMQLGRCFQEMAGRAHVGDDEGLVRSYHQCREVLDHMSGDDSEDSHEQ